MSTDTDTNTAASSTICSVVDCRNRRYEYSQAGRCSRHDALLRLASWLQPGDTLYTILKHTSRSGMQRTIAVVANLSDGPLDVSGMVARAIGRRYDDKHGGVICNGAGMDMGFEVVYALSRALYPDGFPCRGEGCPSSDHVNGEKRTLHPDGGYALSQRWLS